MVYNDFPNNAPNFWAWKNNGDSYEFGLHEAKHFIYQDTDSGYFEVPLKFVESNDLDSIVKCSDEVGNLVNASFKDFIKFSMNIPEERSHLIGTARETVADSGLWLSKKRYILRVKDSEGKRVNKLKMQGVQLKKSNTSHFLKKALLELVEHILDGADVDELNTIIDRQKREFIDADIYDIATPMGCATLNNATQVYELTGRFDGVHYAAKAAALWNITSSNFDTKIMAGEKIRLVYIRGNKLSTSIGFPSEARKLPEWFHRDIKVDYETMWSKAKKTINGYLKAIGFDLESRKVELSKDLFGMVIQKKGKKKK